MAIKVQFRFPPHPRPHRCRYRIESSRTMVVKIYGTPIAACPQRVMHCLVEKGVAFDIAPIDLDKMEQKIPEYLTKQPFGQVPYIEDGDFGLYESRAIVRYYATKYADRGPNLVGRTAEDRARVDQWLDVEAINYNPHAFPIVFNLFILPRLGGAGNAGEARAAAERLGEVLDVMECQLSKTKYLVGDEFTLADLTFIPATRFVTENCGMAHLVADREHVRAWWADVTARSAWKKVMSFAKTGALSYSPEE